MYKNKVAKRPDKYKKEAKCLCPFDWEQEELISASKISTSKTKIHNLLGYVEGVKEWNENSDDAKVKFLHTEAFSQFCDKKDAILLLGRIGTGKTAMIHSLIKTIEDGENETFKYFILIEFEDFIHEFSKYIQFSSNHNHDIYDAIQEKSSIEIFINIEMMRKLYKEKGAPNSIEDYLKSSGLIEKNCFEKVMDSLAANDSACEIMDIIGKFTRMMGQIKNKNYVRALEDLHTFLKEKNALVLIDTLDEYDIRNFSEVIFIKALIKCSFDFLNRFSHDHILIKMGLPTEVYGNVVSYLPGKQQFLNFVMIDWSFNDLIKMIAIRLKFLCLSDKKYAKLFPFSEAYTIGNFYRSKDLASEFLFRILPKYCPTDTSVTSDTLVYCIRHTQKRPRELLMIFNSIVGTLAEKKDAAYFLDNPEKLKDKIHESEQAMVSSILSMYTYHGAEAPLAVKEVCRRILNGRKYLFQGRDLTTALRDIVGATKNQLSPDDIKSILLESGIIGEADEQNTRIIKPGNKVFQSEKELRIICAKFEYQLKETLTFDPQKYYVVHPMCYEFFKCKFDKNTLIFPDSLDDDYDLLKEVLLYEK